MRTTATLSFANALWMTVLPVRIIRRDGGRSWKSGSPASRGTDAGAHRGIAARARGTAPAGNWRPTGSPGQAVVILKAAATPSAHLSSPRRNSSGWRRTTSARTPGTACPRLPKRRQRCARSSRLKGPGAARARCCPPSGRDAQRRPVSSSARDMSGSRPACAGGSRRRHCATVPDAVLPERRLRPGVPGANRRPSGEGGGGAHGRCYSSNASKSSSDSSKGPSSGASRPRSSCQ